MREYIYPLIVVVGLILIAYKLISPLTLITPRVDATQNIPSIFDSVPTILS